MPPPYGEREKDVTEYKKGYTECDCGCNTPVAETPEEMLRFLAGRLEYAGTSDGVAATYARDIRYVLDKYYAEPAPPECKTEEEKTAFAFGWFKALESQRNK